MEEERLVLNLLCGSGRERLGYFGDLITCLRWRELTHPCTRKVQVPNIVVIAPSSLVGAASVMLERGSRAFDVMNVRALSNSPNLGRTNATKAAC